MRQSKSERNFIDKSKRFFRFLYIKLVRINDSPQRIALGFGLGVFFGILPGAGPVASLVMAFIFRVNRVAALIGSILTNTWLSAVTFVLAIKIGSAITAANWTEVYNQCKFLLKNFQWKNLWDISFLDIIRPLAFGYVIIGLLAAVIAYLVTIVILAQRKK